MQGARHHALIAIAAPGSPSLDRSRTMAYFADLTPYLYDGPEPNVLNVGWLDARYAFHRGVTSPEFREALRRLVESPMLLHRGYHVCEFCPPDSRDHGGPPGNGQIRVRGRDGIWYAAPTMVHHYVVAHQYQPPPEFVDAVLNLVAVGQDDRYW
jgi:hypothetical protein